jgi:hypothetical protein
MKRFVVVLTVWAMALAGVLASVVFPSAASAAPTGVGAYASVTPARLSDISIPALNTVPLTVAGKGGLPAASEISAVALNVTVMSPAKGGYVAVFGESARPDTSNISFLAGQNVANLVVAKVVGGKVNLFNGSAARRASTRPSHPPTGSMSSSRPTPRA